MNKKRSVCRSDLLFEVFIKWVTIEDPPYLRHVFKTVLNTKSTGWVDIASSHGKFTFYCLNNLCVLWFWLWILTFFIKKLLIGYFICFHMSSTGTDDTYYLTWGFKMHTVNLCGTSAKEPIYHFSSRFSNSTHQFLLL